MTELKTQEKTKTYHCRHCGEPFENFGELGRHVRTCPQRKDNIPKKEVKPGKDIISPKPARETSPGTTLVKITEAKGTRDVIPRPRRDPTPQVDIKPLQNKIRREEWECRKCLFRWYPLQRPGKCQNCGSPKIQVRAIEEEVAGTPKLDINLFKPLVMFPYDLWAERSGIEEIRLTPAETDLLSENVAAFCNYYMADWMREHGVIVALVMAVSVVSIPKIYLFQVRRKERDKAKPILEEEAQEKDHPDAQDDTSPPAEGGGDLPTAPEPLSTLTPTEKDDRIRKAFSPEK